MTERSGDIPANPGRPDDSPPPVAPRSGNERADSVEGESEESLHPVLRRYLNDEAASRSSWREMGVKLARSGYRVVALANGRGPTPDVVEDVKIGGVLCRRYRPAEARGGLIMYFHGGGFVMGDLETHDATCRRIAVQSGVELIAVDYRLAPEHRYPAAHDDCERVTREAARLAGLAFTEVVVAGDSAGGCLAAAVAARLHDTGDQLAGQCLLYPGIDSRCETESYRTYASGYGLTAETMHWFWSTYLGDIPRKVAPPDAAPSSRTRVDGLPPAFAMTCAFDVLRDEGEIYATRLLEAGVPTRLVRWPRVIHGFLQLAGILESGEEATLQVGDVAAAMIEGRFEELAQPPLKTLR